jgi:N-acetylmuramoyl-L-alanine amidase
VFAVSVVALLAVASASADQAIEIIDEPISFDKERERLTIEYRKIHQDPEADSIEITPKVVVIHYTAGSSKRSTWRYFNKTRLKGRKKLLEAGAVNVSAHFLVARNGTIYRLMPETTMGRHTIGLNHLAIGIENVGDGDEHPLTSAQLEANAKLVRYLSAKHPITHLIGHHEYRKMESHDYWLERDPKYRNNKPDPGPAFMTKLRKKVKSLELQKPPD